MTGAEAYHLNAAGTERLPPEPAEASAFFAILRGRHHVFEYANTSFLQLLNRECIGRPVAQAIPEAVDQGFVELLDGVYRSGEPFQADRIQVPLRSPATGEQRDHVLSFSFRAIRGAQGAVTGVCVEGFETNRRSDAAATLHAMRSEGERQWAELESIYDSAPVGLALLGPTRFEYRRLNQRQAEIIGLPAEEILGKTVRESSPDVADAAEALFRKVVEGELVRDVELGGELPERPGEYRSWIVSYSPILLGDGTVDAIICSALETTELRRAERVAVQNEKLAAVGRLAASIAHEINNPLEAITNLLYLARSSENLAETKQLLEAADGELRRVAAITTQTLQFHRQATESREAGCDELLDGALTIFRGRLESQRVRVERRMRAQSPVRCFDAEIRQVLNNLMGNAFDAMSPGGQLSLRSREGTDWRSGRRGVWLTVSDTGAGMSPETLQRVFEPFFTTKGMRGSGLGLWITQEIVTRHTGVLRMRSCQRVGRSGTTVSLFLPFEAARRNGS